MSATGAISLSEDLLARIRDRAAGADAANRFPDADLAELRDAGYLRAAVPASLGGGGLTLRELTRTQARLAGAAPATALAVNMHQVWVAVAAGLHAAGDGCTDFVLAEAAGGELFAFAISEPGNDLVLFGSLSEARPDGSGGYHFYGTKIFTSLSPAWTRLGTFGTDTSGPEPLSVFGFINREDGGFRILDDWDTLGMRASQSCTTMLEGAHAPAARIVRRIAPGRTQDAFVTGIFACFEILVASVYAGVAQRALDLAVAAARRRVSRRLRGAPLATDPDVRSRLARAAIGLDGARLQIEALAAEVDAAADHDERWLPRLSAVKQRAVRVAIDVMRDSVEVCGGSAYSSTDELSRLYRDVLAGVFHPSTEASTVAAWAELLLGPLE